MRVDARFAFAVDAVLFAAAGGVAGRFVARFAGFTIPRCTAYAISARGNKGSVASWKVTPDCAAPQGGAGPTNPGTEEPAAMFPTDPIPKKR